MADDRDLDETLATKNPGPAGGRTGIGGAARRDVIDERVEAAVSGTKKKKSNNLPAPPTNEAGAKAAQNEVGFVREFLNRITGS